MTTELLLAFVTGYLLGSIPFGLILTRIAGKGDVRAVGSGNIGATNVVRAGGKTLGALTLVLDALKATAAIVVVRAVWPGAEAFAAAGALIGHLYPVWLKFRGGKGVATLLGILIGLFPVGAAVYALVWIAVFAIVRISSVAGILAAFSAPVSAALLGGDPLFAMLVAFALLILWRHRDNIIRLRAGAEHEVDQTNG